MARALIVIGSVNGHMVRPFMVPDRKTLARLRAVYQRQLDGAQDFLIDQVLEVEEGSRVLQFAKSLMDVPPEHLQVLDLKPSTLTATAKKLLRSCKPLPLVKP